ncbi:MAG: CaiB/BaiF CoA-transferase family protein [Acidobacteriota bacterium]|nr:CaiB/BaiF CoA-transferase family protein [Acidobacteriota bacterium]
MPQPAGETRQSRGPLSGIRVIDLTRLYPGPLGSMMLADMGAEVIKIEDNNKPDYMRHYPPYLGKTAAGYLAVNRGKRSLALEIDSPEGLAVIKRMVKEADIFVEGFRPGVLKRFGLDYESLAEVNPRLIYVSITGYGQDGPYERKAGHDLNYVGYSGVMDTMGNKTSGPLAPGVQMADVAGGAYMAVIGALAALQARQTTGKGQWVDVAMLDGVLPLATLQLAHYSAMPRPPQRGEFLLSGGTACYGIYACACGGHVALGALEPKFWQAFCHLADQPNWVKRHLCRGKENDRLEADLKALFLTRTRDEWIDLAGDADACLTPLRTLTELADDPQLKHRQMIQTITTPDGHMTLAGAPIKFSETPCEIDEQPAPELGRDSVEVLAECGFTKEEIEALYRKGILK